VIIVFSFDDHPFFEKSLKVFVLLEHEYLMQMIELETNIETKTAEGNIVK